MLSLDYMDFFIVHKLIFNKVVLKVQLNGVGEMSQWLRTTLAQDLDLVPSAYTEVHNLL